MGKILVTGAAGFVGSSYVRSLNQPVISVDDRRHFDRPEIAHTPYGDVVDREELFGQLEGLAPKTIVHLGACTKTTEFDEEYLERINTEYSKKLWTYATDHQIPFVYASSAATYGDGEKGYDDDESKIHGLAPLNPYGWSKQRFDLWALEQERAGKAPPAWSGFKFFNVYGFGERHKKGMSSVVLQSFDQINEKGRVRLFRSHKDGYKDGEQKRDFIYVGDVVEVLNFALTSPIKRGIYNLGTGQARTFLDLVHATFAAMNQEARVDFIDTPENIRDKYQYFTEAKMEKLREAGYSKPFTSLEDGVAQYVRDLSKA